MRSLPTDLIDALPLADAALAEANHTNPLLPTLRGWEYVQENPGAVADMLKARLRSGLATSPQVVISTRKLTHGVRPFPVWGVAERIVYRALTEHLLQGEPELDRSPQAYHRFQLSPIQHAVAHPRRRRTRVR